MRKAGLTAPGRNARRHAAAAAAAAATRRAFIVNHLLGFCVHHHNFPVSTTHQQPRVPSGSCHRSHVSGTHIVEPALECSSRSSATVASAALLCCSPRFRCFWCCVFSLVSLSSRACRGISQLGALGSPLAAPKDPNQVAQTGPAAHARQQKSRQRQSPQTRHLCPTPRLTTSQRSLATIITCALIERVYAECISSRAAHSPVRGAVQRRSVGGVR